MNRDEYNTLFHRLELNLVAFKRLMDCDEEVLKLVNAAIEAERTKISASVNQIHDWYSRAQLSQCDRCGEVNPAEIHTCTPKYEWQGLTNAEIDWLWGLAFEAKLDNMPRHFARMIEENLKEKNT